MAISQDSLFQEKGNYFVFRVSPCMFILKSFWVAHVWFPARSYVVSLLHVNREPLRQEARVEVVWVHGEVLPSCAHVKLFQPQRLPLLWEIWLTGQMPWGKENMRVRNNSPYEDLVGRMMVHLSEYFMQLPWFPQTPPWSRQVRYLLST